MHWKTVFVTDIHIHGSCSVVAFKLQKLINKKINNNSK